MSPRAPFRRDPSHWLLRLSPEEWISAALTELERARGAFATRNAAAALVGLKRAAGMALNGALITRPNEAWGRKYSEHLVALADDDQAPDEVRHAARLLGEASPPSGPIVSLRTPSEEQRIVEATRTVMAHAYALVHGSASLVNEKPPSDEKGR